MTPFERARAVYENEPCARTFEEDLSAHLQRGYVISTPTAFIMAREVNSAAHHEAIVNPWIAFDPTQCDTWMIYLAAGDLSQMWPHMPHKHKWLAWERKNVLRFRRFTRPILCTNPDRISHLT